MIGIFRHQLLNLLVITFRQFEQRLFGLLTRVTAFTADKPAARMRPGAETVSYTHLDVYKRQPLYLLRGLQLISWRDMQHALDYLFADGALREGTLVAINAEKMLAVEDNPEVRALIEAAEFKYADGISVVRSLRKKYPQAQVCLLYTSRCV